MFRFSLDKWRFYSNKKLPFLYFLNGCAICVSLYNNAYSGRIVRAFSNIMNIYCYQFFLSVLHGKHGKICNIFPVKILEMLICISLEFCLFSVCF